MIDNDGSWSGSLLRVIGVFGPSFEYRSRSQRLWATSVRRVCGIKAVSLGLMATARVAEMVKLITGLSMETVSATAVVATVVGTPGAVALGTVGATGTQRGMDGGAAVATTLATAGAEETSPRGAQTQSMPLPRRGSPCQHNVFPYLSLRARCRLASSVGVSVNV